MPSARQRLEDRQELDDLRVIHRRCRLVDEHHLGARAQPRGDLHERPLYDRQIGDRRVEVDAAYPEPVEPAVDLPAGGPPVEEDAGPASDAGPSSTLSSTLMSGQTSSSWGTEPTPAFMDSGRTVAEQPVALDRDGAVVGHDAARRRRRQGRLAGAVLARRRPAPHLRGRSPTHRRAPGRRRTPWRR